MFQMIYENNFLVRETAFDYFSVQRNIEQTKVIQTVLKKDSFTVDLSLGTSWKLSLTKLVTNSAQACTGTNDVPSCWGKLALQVLFMNYNCLELLLKDINGWKFYFITDQK